MPRGSSRTSQGHGHGRGSPASIGLMPEGTGCAAAGMGAIRSYARASRRPVLDRGRRACSRALVKRTGRGRRRRRRGRHADTGPPAAVARTPRPSRAMRAVTTPAWAQPPHRALSSTNRCSRLPPALGVSFPRDIADGLHDQHQKGGVALGSRFTKDLQFVK